MRKFSILVLIAFSIIIFIIGSDFLWMWLPIAHSSEYPTKIAAFFMAATALFTLFLATATFITIEQSNLRERDRIKDDRERENRLRKERYINEIIGWAQDIQQLTYDTNPDTYLLKGKNLVAMLFNICRNMQVRAKSMSYIADFLAKDLKDAIQITSIKLDTCTDSCKGLLLAEEGPQLEDAMTKFTQLSLDTVKSTDAVIKQATNVKVSLL